MVIKTRLLTALVVATVVMQAIILYRQPTRPSPPKPFDDAPQGVSVKLADFPLRGAATAKTVVIEFSDFQCPFCARHATTVMPELIKTYVDNGKIRYAVANLPLPMHSNAEWLARAAMCAGEQGKYWEMHEALFVAKQDAKPDLAALADQLKIDGTHLQGCVNRENSGHLKVIERDAALAKQLGFIGTPAFAVARVGRDNTVTVVKIIRGAAPFDTFAEVIEEVSDEI